MRDGGFIVSRRARETINHWGSWPTVLKDAEGVVVAPILPTEARDVLEAFEKNQAVAAVLPNSANAPVLAGTVGLVPPQVSLLLPLRSLPPPGLIAVHDLGDVPTDEALSDLASRRLPCFLLSQNALSKKIYLLF